MTSTLASPLATLPRVAVSGTSLFPGERVLAEETAVALVYDGATHAVMLASPALWSYGVETDWSPALRISGSDRCTLRT